METSRQQPGRHFFIGANTADGFVNFAGDPIREAERVYIIKGGPGTGKSTLMSRFAAWAEEEGETVAYYHCSSDPASLDGVLLEKRRIFVTDGTAPHTAEAKYPGAKETILDVGRGLDSRMLRSRLEEIRRLAGEKADAYRRVCRAMKMQALFREEAGEHIASFLLNEKLNAAAGRFVSRLGKGSGFRQAVRQVSSVGMKGEVTLDTLRELAEEIYLVTDADLAGNLFLSAVSDAAGKAGQRVYVSYDRFLRPSSLFFPERAVLLSSELPGSLSDRDRIIHTERFTDREKKLPHRSALRMLKKQDGEVRQHILALFREIRDAHFGLEAIYRDAMDFSVRDELLEKLKRETLTGEGREH